MSQARKLSTKLQHNTQHSTPGCASIRAYRSVEVTLCYNLSNLASPFRLDPQTTPSLRYWWIASVSFSFIPFILFPVVPSVGGKKSCWKKISAFGKDIFAPRQTDSNAGRKFDQSWKMLFSPRPGQFSYFSVYFAFARKRAMEGRAKANKKQTLVESRYEKSLVRTLLEQSKPRDPTQKLTIRSRACWFSKLKIIKLLLDLAWVRWMNRRRLILSLEFPVNVARTACEWFS